MHGATEAATPEAAQVVLGDGSVKFLSETMDALTFWRLTYIHDGGCHHRFLVAAANHFSALQYR
jgi:hypothetical protein